MALAPVLLIPADNPPRSASPCCLSELFAQGCDGASEGDEISCSLTKPAVIHNSVATLVVVGFWSSSPSCARKLLCSAPWSKHRPRPFTAREPRTCLTRPDMVSSELGSRASKRTSETIELFRSINLKIADLLAAPPSASGSDSYSVIVLLAVGLVQHRSSTG